MYAKLEKFWCFLNPGPFNIKEHAIITIMANVSFGGGAAYATDILLSQNKFYNSDFGWGYALLLIWSTQCIGFAFGGLMRRFVVDSPSAIWPLNLVTVTFLTNMHINENHVANGWKISRLAFFPGCFRWFFCLVLVPRLYFPSFIILLMDYLD